MTNIVKKYISFISYGLSAYISDMYTENELDFFRIDEQNNNYSIFRREKLLKRYNERDKEEYKNKIIVEAIGGTQGEWQEYSIYYREGYDKIILESLEEFLRNSFTIDDIAIKEEIISCVDIEGKVYENTEIQIIEVQTFMDTDMLVLEEFARDLLGDRFDEYIIDYNVKY